MNTVQVLEQQVQQLAPEEMAEFRAWFHAYEQALDKGGRCAITGMTAGQSASISRAITDTLLQTHPDEQPLREA
jgi:D-arabinose 5-phosphate isomerase GutQ